MEKETISILTTLFDSFPNTYLSDDRLKRTLKTYSERLADVPPDLLRQAVEQAVASLEKVPSVAHLRKMAMACRANGKATIPGNFQVDPEVAPTSISRRLWDAYYTQVKHFYGEQIFIPASWERLLAEARAQGCSGLAGTIERELPVMAQMAAEHPEVDWRIGAMASEVRANLQKLWEALQ